MTTTQQIKAAAINAKETISYGGHGWTANDTGEVIKGCGLGSAIMGGVAAFTAPAVSIPLMLLAMGAGSASAARDYRFIRRDIQTGENRKRYEQVIHAPASAVIPTVQAIIEPPIVTNKCETKPVRGVGINRKADVVNRAFATKEFKFPVSVCLDSKGFPMIDTKPATVDVYTIETNAGSEGWDVTKIEKEGENFSRACGLPEGTVITVNPNIGDGLAAMYVSKQKARLVRFEDVYKAVDDNPMHFAMGEDTKARVAIENLDRLPHIKIVGMPGGGKTVLFRSIMLSLARSTSPMDVRFYIADPKGTDFIALKHLMHTKTHAVTPQEMDDMLADLLSSCEKRAEMFAKGGVKGIDGWNAMYPSRKLPRLVLAVEEMTSVVGKAEGVIVYRDEEVDKGNGNIVTRQVKDGTLADKIIHKLVILAITYRYAGLRMILGTQRMDSDVFPGSLSAAIPGTIGLAAPNRVAAQQMMQSNMPANLKFPGEACVKMPGQSIDRIIGAYIDDKTNDDEIIAKGINNYWRNRLKEKHQS